MSAEVLSLKPAGAAGTRASNAAPARHGWLREPLLHFALAGSLLFALDHWLVSRADDPRTIVMGAAVDEEARRVFAAARGHDPDAEELKALRQVWLDNEVLYREGLALQMDKGDQAIRDRVIFKALSVIEAGVKLPEIDDAGLRAWFEQHRAKYDEPARFDFEEAALPGSPSESEVRDLAAALNGGRPGDDRASLRVFKGRPQSNIDGSYGPEFTAALQASSVGEWRGLRDKGGIWRTVRLTALAPAHLADYEAVRGPVLQDWKDTVASEMRSEAVRVMTKKYRIVTPPPGK
jgi:hypothetical protein